MLIHDISEFKFTASRIKHTLHCFDIFELCPDIVTMVEVSSWRSNIHGFFMDNSDQFRMADLVRISYLRDSLLELVIE